MVFVSNLTVNIHVLAKEIYTGIVFWFLALMKNHFEVTKNLQGHMEKHCLSNWNPMKSLLLPKACNTTHYLLMSELCYRCKKNAVWTGVVKVLPRAILTLQISVTNRPFKGAGAAVMHIYPNSQR